MVKTNYKEYVATQTEVCVLSITEKAVLNQGWQMRIRGELKLFSIKVGESGKYATQNLSKQD